MQEKIDELECCIDQYEDCVQKTITEQEEVIKAYKEILDTGHLLGGLLSLSERIAIQEEIKKTKSILNLNLRSKETNDLLDVLDPYLFNRLVARVRKECPTIMNIIEQLVLSSNVYILPCS